MKSTPKAFTPVPAEIVTQTWQEVASMSAVGIPGLINEMRIEQPALLVYLLAVSEAAFDRAETELVVYLGVVVWQIMRRWYKPLMSVSIKKLDQAEEENFAGLDSMPQITEASMWTHTQFMLETYPEPEVLRYVVEALMETNPVDLKLSEDRIGLAFIYLKTALDALIRCRVQ